MTEKFAKILLDLAEEIKGRDYSEEDIVRHLDLGHDRYEEKLILYLYRNDYDGYLKGLLRRNNIEFNDIDMPSLSNLIDQRHPDEAMFTPRERFVIRAAQRPGEAEGQAPEAGPGEEYVPMRVTPEQMEALACIIPLFSRREWYVRRLKRIRTARDFARNVGEDLIRENLLTFKQLKQRKYFMVFLPFMPLLAHNRPTTMYDAIVKYCRCEDNPSAVDD